MKAELNLPQELVDQIVGQIIDKLKPMLSSNRKSDSSDRIFNKKELADYLGVDVSWIDKKVSTNEIPYSKFGKYVRFKKSLIDKWIESKTVKPVSPLKLINSRR